MPKEEPLPDERSMRNGVCGEIRWSANIEWICIRRDHYYKGKGGNLRMGILPPRYKHYFVRRWPNR